MEGSEVWRGRPGGGCGRSSSLLWRDGVTGRLPVFTVVSSVNRVPRGVQLSNLLSGTRLGQSLHFFRIF